MGFRYDTRMVAPVCRPPYARLLGLTLAILSALACGSGGFGPPYDYANPPGLGQNRTASGVSADEALARVRARGTVHGAPVRIDASGGRPERWVVFLGNADAAHAAWIVTPGMVPEATPADGWPTAVRVAGTV